MIGVLVILIIISVGLWLVNTKIPMPGWLRIVINVVAGIFVVLYLMQVFGIPIDAPVPQLFHRRY